MNALQHSVSRSTVYPEGERHAVSHSILAYSNRQKQKQFQLTPTRMSWQLVSLEAFLYSLSQTLVLSKNLCSNCLMNLSPEHRVIQPLHHAWNRYE